MSTVEAVVMVALGLWTIWFAVSGVAFALRLLQRPEGGKSPLPAGDLRRVGGMLLVGVAGVLVATSLIAAVLATAGPPDLSRVDATLSRWDAAARHYGTALRGDFSALRRRVAG